MQRPFFAPRSASTATSKSRIGWSVLTANPLPRIKIPSGIINAPVSKPRIDAKTIFCTEIGQHGDQQKQDRVVSADRKSAAQDQNTERYNQRSGEQAPDRCKDHFLHRDRPARRPAKAG